MTFMGRWISKKTVIVSTFFNEAILRLTTKYKGYTADGIRKSYIKVGIIIISIPNYIILNKFGLDPHLALPC